MQIFFIVMKFIWCSKKFEIFPKQTDAILFPFLIFPGKNLISCYSTFTFIQRVVENYQNYFEIQSSISISTAQRFLGKGLELIKFGGKHEYLWKHRR